jgi:hypothetical protein
LVNDARQERAQLDALLEILPKARHREALELAERKEAEHRAVLEERRRVLAKLVQRAEDAHAQVLLRLRALEDQYAFARTHIFWLRDAEPLGPATLRRVQAESRQLARALVRIGMECGDATNWGRVSAEFALLMLLFVALPWPLLLARQALDVAGGR